MEWLRANSKAAKVNATAGRFYTGYTVNNALGFSAFVFNDTHNLLNGNAAANRHLISATQPVDWQPGQYLIFRWLAQQPNVGGNAAQKLAVNDIQLTLRPPQSLHPSRFSGSPLSGWLRAGIGKPALAGFPFWADTLCSSCYSCKTRVSGASYTSCTRRSAVFTASPSGKSA